MEWTRAQLGDEGNVRIPKNWLSLHYFEALNLLFRIENSLRVFAYAVLKTEHGSEWLDISLSSEDENGAASSAGTIKSIGRRRLNQAKAFGYLGYVSPSPLLYLSMGELVSLMFSDAYWKIFSPHFVGVKSTMRVKLDEINAIRNALAHFRPLKEDDIDVIRQNAKHAMMGIESFLSGLTQCTDVVPSNSQEAWYKELSSLGSDSLHFQLRQNRKSDWIEVNVTYTSPILTATPIDQLWNECRLVKLDSPTILKIFPALCEHVVFLTENQSAYMHEGSVRYQKWLSFVFSKKVLEKNVVSVAEAFKEFINSVKGELDLLSQDNLARGELLSVSQVWSWFSRGDEKTGAQAQWHINIDALSSPPDDDAPPEYWGNLGWLGKEFITKREKYPWMSSPISGIEL